MSIENYEMDSRDYLAIKVKKLESELEQAQAKIEQIKKWPECRNKKHLELETDGTVICQHCYRDVIDENARLKEDISALATFGKPDLTMGWPYYWQEEIYKIIQRAKVR